MQCDHDSPGMIVHYGMVAEDVGVMDTDIYGPSVPILLRQTTRLSGNLCPEARDAPDIPIAGFSRLASASSGASG